MRIGVDAGCLGIKDQMLKVGVYQMAKNLLIELGKIDKENKYLLYSFYPIEKSLLKEFGKNMRNIVVKPSRGWFKIWLPFRIYKDKPNVFLGLSQALPKKLPFSPPLRTIGFVHDLAFEKFPKMYPDSLSSLRRNTKNLVKNSDFIFTFSNSSKKDIIDSYRINADKIIVSYQGIPESCVSKNKNKKPDIPYFLFVGALKRIKNVSGIISAFSLFLKNNSLDYDLYIVGGDLWPDPEIKSTLTRIDPVVINKIKFLKFIEDEDLGFFYKNATAFVSPSFYEGFGLTFIEAMSLGCPVIGSNKGSIPEIIGDAGILVNPTDHEEIAKAMEDLLDPKKRKLYIGKGLKKSREFSWNKFATDLLSIYEEKT